MNWLSWSYSYIGKHKLGFKLKKLFPNAICFIFHFSKLFLSQVITLLYCSLVFVYFVVMGTESKVSSILSKCPRT